MPYPVCRWRAPWTPWLLIICALTACGDGPSYTSLGRADAPTTLPVELDGPHASIQILINGRPTRMLLDTGADQNVLTPAAASRLGLAPSSGQTTGSGGGGAVGPVSWTTVDDVVIGDIHQRHQVAYIVPVPAEFTYDGLLGTPFFDAFVTTIDYQNRLLTLRSRSSFTPPTGVDPVPVDLVGGKLLVTATAAGVTSRYLVDIGASNTLTFSTPTVEQYGLRTGLTPSMRMVTGVSTGGFTHGDLVRIPELVVGSHTLHNVVSELSLEKEGVFANPAFAGNLGGELWRRFTLTLDYAGGRIYLQPNGSYSDPFVGPRAGLFPNVDRGRITIVDVTPNSPAADAGVRIGDILVAVDGAALPLGDEDTTRTSLRVIADALRQAPGTNVRLLLIDATGTEREGTLVLRDLI